MNTTFQYFTILCISTVFFAFPLLIGKYMKKARHRGLLFKAGFIYNITLALAQANFFLNGNLPFLDTFENSYFVFTGLVFAILHVTNIGTLANKAYTIPDTRRAFDNNLIELVNITLDKVIIFTKFTLIILASSAFYAAMIGALLINALTTEPPDHPTHKFIGLILYLILAIVGTYLTYRQFKSKRYNSVFVEYSSVRSNISGRKLLNIFRGVKPNWILFTLSIYCAAMTPILLDRFTDFDIQTSPWRNITRAAGFVFFLGIWLFGTIFHHGARRKSNMKKLK